MTARRLLIGIVILALLSILWTGIGDFVIDGRSTSILPSADVTSPTWMSAEQQADFTMTDLQGGEEVICSDDAQGWADDAPAQTYEEMTRMASERLAVSSSAEHLLAAALLETDPASQLDLIESALIANPTDPLLLWSAVRICSDSNDSPDCPLREWEQRLIAVDGQNSESWMRVAANQYAAGEVSAALESMQLASTAAESKVYWPEMMELIERELRSVSDFPFPARVSLALGVAGAELPLTGAATMCREQSAASLEWAYVCLTYGELLERQAKTFYGISIAGSVQRLALEAMGEFERAEAAEERIEAIRQELYNSNNGEVLQLITTVPNLFYSYIAALKSVGEVAAQGHIAADVERLASTCAGPQSSNGSRPEWVTMRDTTETEAIYSALRQAGSPDSQGMSGIERRTGLVMEALEAFQAFGVEVYQRDLQHEIETVESFCDERAPTTREALLVRLESMTEAQKQLKEDTVNELFRRLTPAAVDNLRSAYAPDTRSWTSRTAETDFAAMVEEVDPTEMRDRACNALAAAREQDLF